MNNRRGRLALVIVAVLSIILIIGSLRGNGSRSVGNNALSPFQSVVHALTDPITGFFGGISRIRSNEKRIADLQERNDQLLLQLRDVSAQSTRVQQFRDTLGLAGLAKYTIVPAQVVTIGPKQGFAWSVSLDVGTRDGITTGQTVINGKGLVGRVVSVGRSSATVLLAIDPTSSVGARAARSAQVGIASGNGLDGLTLQMLNPLVNLTKGSQVVTFGSPGGRPFVPGVPIGTISGVSRASDAGARTWTVTPYVDFTSLDIVGVVVAAPSRDPRDALLPKPPAPVPTVTVTVGPTPTPSVSASKSPTSRPSVTPTAGA